MADDPTLSEDAYFVLDVAWPTQTTDTVHYVGLADGVGSWRKLGVDPREFRCVARRVLPYAFFVRACSCSNFGNFGNFGMYYRTWYIILYYLNSV